MQSKLVPALAVIWCLSGCSGGEKVLDGKSPTGAGTPVESGIVETGKFGQILEGYFEEMLQLNPVFATVIGDKRFNDKFENDIGPDHLKKALELEKRYLTAILELDRDHLEGQDLLSYEIFRRGRETAIEGYKFPSHLLPVNQFFSVPNSFAQMGAGAGVHPFQTRKDYEDFLKRIDGFATWVDQAIANMREGIEQDIVQPRVLMDRTLPQLSAHVVEDPEKSLFYGPVENFPERMSRRDRQFLTEAYSAAIRDKVIPSYRKLHDFIRDEYLPHTREEVGLRALPGGEEWYLFLVKRTTTTDLSPTEIHRTGLEEVERIHGEMETVKAEVGFEGDLDAFFRFLNEDPRFYFGTKDDLLNGYRDMKDRVHALALVLFDVFPRADYEVRPVEPFREKSASGASYRGATPDGSRPGVFFVNTYDLKARPNWALESLFLHEAVPGHHFQRSIQREIEELPRFRRFGSYTAYVEGWGLYAESLGKELGLYGDPYQHFGALAAELWRAIRLVVDTGLHDQGWSREKVLEFMYSNTAVKEARAVSEAERYIAIPSQALAYKIGQLKISELRRRAEERLGEKFDVKAFHAQVLQDGALPLDVLEAKMDRWLEGQS